MGSGFPRRVHAGAHDWRQVLTFQGKSCLVFGSPAILKRHAPIGAPLRMRLYMASEYTTGEPLSMSGEWKREKQDRRGPDGRALMLLFISAISAQLSE